MAEFGIEIPKGSPGGIEAGAQSLKSTIGSLERVYSQLQVGGSIAGWRGLAALSYNAQAVHHAQSAGYASDAMGQAAQALTRAAHVLEHARHLAKSALEDARDADRRMKRAQERIDAASSAASTAQNQIAQLDFQSALAPGLQLPGVAAARGQAVLSLQSAQQEGETARRELDQAQHEREAAQKKGGLANELWNEEGDRTGAELEGLAGAAGSVAPALGLAPRPSLFSGGGADLLATSTFPLLPGVPKRNPPPPPEDDSSFWNEIPHDFPFMLDLPPALPPVGKWGEAFAKTDGVVFLGCYASEAWTDERDDPEDELHDLVACSPGGFMVPDNGD